MSVYRCSECEEYKDADEHGCNENPRNEYECICDNCEEKILIFKEGRNHDS